MKSSQLKLERLKIFRIQTLFNLLSIRSASIFIIIIWVGLLFGCSTEVNGPEFNHPGFDFENGDWDFEAEERIDFELPFKNHNRVNLEAINGEVIVRGQSNAGKIAVTARKHVGSDSQEVADLNLDDMDILVSQSPDEILIQTVQPNDTNGLKCFVEYDISVPSHLEVMTTQVNGGTLIFDIANNVDVSNMNGDILLSNIAGGIVADAVNGSIEASVVLPVNETINMGTQNGNIDLNIPISTSASFEASVGNGTLQTSNFTLPGAAQTSRSLNGVLGNGDGAISLWTVRGDITILGYE